MNNKMTPMPADEGEGPCILVVEDEAIVGMDLVMFLEEAGYRPDGPHLTPSDALASLEKLRPDFAILDVNLGNGQTSVPVADALDRYAVPYLFLTGYNPERALAEHGRPGAPRLAKPVDFAELKKAIEGSL